MPHNAGGLSITDCGARGYFQPETRAALTGNSAGGADQMNLDLIIIAVELIIAIYHFLRLIGVI
jgi:hypothetical protein